MISFFFTSLFVSHMLNMLHSSSLSLVWALLFSTAFGRKSQQPLKVLTNPLNNKEFEDLVDFSLEQWNVPGLSIAVVDGDDIWAEVWSLTTFSYWLANPKPKIISIAISRANKDRAMATPTFQIRKPRLTPYTTVAA